MSIKDRYASGFYRCKRKRKIAIEDVMPGFPQS